MILFRLMILFLLLPVVELILLIEVGRRIGTPATIVLVLVTGALGAALARSQGMRVLRSIRHDVDQGRVPAEEVVEGVLILIGGLLLLTPGLLTDITGFLLVLPFTRRFLIGWLRWKLTHWLRSGTLRLYLRR